MQSLGGTQEGYIFTHVSAANLIKIKKKSTWIYASYILPKRPQNQLSTYHCFRKLSCFI